MLNEVSIENKDSILKAIDSNKCLKDFSVSDAIQVERVHTTSHFKCQSTVKDIHQMIQDAESDEEINDILSIEMIDVEYINNDYVRLEYFFTVLDLLMVEKTEYGYGVSAYSTDADNKIIKGSGKPIEIKFYQLTEIQ